MGVADSWPTVTARVTGSLHISDQARLLRFSSPDIRLHTTDFRTCGSGCH